MKPASAPMARALRLAANLLLMMLVWLLWSGYFKPLLVTLGVVSCVLVAVLSWRMGNLEHEGAWQRRLLRFPAYWLWMGKEIIKSNLEVAWIILRPQQRLACRRVTIAAAATDPFGQALLGNSITLTPGTMTLAIEDGRLHVHCLTEKSARTLADGEMNQRVAAVTGP